MSLAYDQDYAVVPAGSNAQALGPNGKKGNVLNRLVCAVKTAATSAVTIADGNGAQIPVLPANTPIGVYTVTLYARSNQGAWSVTAGAGSDVIATGRFT